MQLRIGAESRLASVYEFSKNNTSLYQRKTEIDSIEEIESQPSSRAGFKRPRACPEFKNDSRNTDTNRIKDSEGNQILDL